MRTPALRRILAVLAVAGLACLSTSAHAKPSGNWRIEFNSRTDNDGVIVLRIAPIEGGGDPIEVETKVPKGTSENNVAELVSSSLKATLGSNTKLFEKSFFDLTKEKPIRTDLKRLNKKQIVVAGCETDVCVLQSCLGLLDLGFDVFAVEELLFSSASRTDAAVERLKGAGVIFVSYKTLFFELTEAVADGPHADKMIARLGAFPDDIPEDAEH